MLLGLKSRFGGFSMAEAVGAFTVSAALITLFGVAGGVEKIMNRIPVALASALLAGVLALLYAIVFIAARGHLYWAEVTFHLKIPVWTTPKFIGTAAVSLAVPLFVVAMASQNLPGAVALFGQQYGQQRRMPLPGPAPTTQAFGPSQNP